MSTARPDADARAARRYLVATAINIFGTGIQGIAIPWLLLELTGTAAAVGVLLILRAVPTIALSSWAGALCDSHSRRRIAIAASAVQAVATLATAAYLAAGHRDTTSLYVLTLIVGTGTTFFMPATRAYMQTAVGPGGYHRLASLTETATMLGLIAGTAVGGPLLTTAGIAVALAIDGVTFLWAAIAFARMPEQARSAAAPRRSGLAAQVEGLRYIAGRPMLALAAALSLVPVLCIQVDNVLVSAYVRDALALDAAAFSRINLAYAVGAALVGVVLSRIGKRLDNARAIAAGFVALGLAHLGFGTSADGLVATATMFAVGVTLVGVRTLLTTRIMLNSEPAFAGRVQAAQQLAAGLLTIGLGAAVGGLAALTGYAAVFAVVAAACLLGAIGVTVLGEVRR